MKKQLLNRLFDLYLFAVFSPAAMPLILPFFIIYYIVEEGIEI